MKPEQKLILHNSALDEAIEDLKEIKMRLPDPVLIKIVPHKKPPRPETTEPFYPLPAVTNEMIYNAIRSLAQAIEHLSNILEKPKDFL
jgi:hypothetical protein